MKRVNKLQDWKLKLRYGSMKTAFHHFTIIMDGEVMTANEDYGITPGPAFMAIKTWVSDMNEASELAVAVGRDIGFSAKGNIQIYDSDPLEPPRERPYGYGINFTPYEA